MSSVTKWLNFRSVVVLVVLGLTSAYIVQIVRGKVATANRLATNDIILVALASFASILLLRPEIIQRLSKVELPGLKVELDAVKEKQEAQENELESIRLAMPLLLPEKERVHLRGLATGDCKNYQGRESIRNELRHLRSMDLIRLKRRHNIGELRDGSVFDLAEYVELTQSGRDWLERLAKMEAKQA